jgi:RNA:NAD 2'-phosphotransferase (TPT1/KptA family)
MKKSAISLFAVATLAFTSLLGCDATKSDLSKYSKTAVPVYNSYSEKFGAKMGEAGNANSAEEFAAKNKEVIALLDEFRTKMAEIKPESKEVQDLHQNCVTNLTNMEDGYKQLGDALEKHDQTVAQAGKAKIEDAVKADEKFRSDLKALEEKHHVQVQ